MTIRNPVIRKIKALQQKTVARGATEHEATAALAKVADLMAAHGVSATDIQFDDKLLDYAASIKRRAARQREEEQARRERAKAARRRRRQSDSKSTA